MIRTKCPVKCWYTYQYFTALQVEDTARKLAEYRTAMGCI